ncbi:MAG TPA: hypothetical protein VIS48_00600 [Candidatus Kryptonia bacterium]
MTDETRAIVASNLTLAFFYANPAELIEQQRDPRVQYTVADRLQKLIDYYLQIFSTLKEQESA